MSQQPHLNISLKWKIAGLFLLAFATPVALFLAAAPSWVLVTASVLVTTLLAWYAGRIFGMIAHLLKLANRLNVYRPGPPPKYSQDELNDLIHTFDDFYHTLETSYENRRGEAATAAPTATPADSEESELARAVRGRAVFTASLSTGNPVAGEATALPRRADEELAQSSRLTGAAARRLFQESVGRVKEQLAQLIDVPELEAEQKGIIEFQQLLLEDEALLKGVDTCLGENLTLPESLNTTFAVITAKLEASKNAYIAARAADCLDLKQRLLETLARKASPDADDAYAALAGKIVFCEQVFPSEVIMLFRARVAGLVCAEGTASSHAEILLQSFNLPSLTNLEGLPLHLLKGRQVLLDTLRRRLIVDPQPEEIQDLAGRAPVAADDIIRGPVTLRNGEAVSVCATINNVTVEAML